MNKLLNMHPVHYTYIKYQNHFRAESEKRSGCCFCFFSLEITQANNPLILHFLNQLEEINKKFQEKLQNESVKVYGKKLEININTVDRIHTVGQLEAKEQAVIQIVSLIALTLSHPDIRNLNSFQYFLLELQTEMIVAYELEGRINNMTSVCTHR